MVENKGQSYVSYDVFIGFSVCHFKLLLIDDHFRVRRTFFVLRCYCVLSNYFLYFILQYLYLNSNKHGQFSFDRA